MGKIKIIYIMGLTMILMFILFFGNKMNENKTAGFFEGIEIQYETKEQKEVIIEVLEDMLTLDAEDLKKKEYPDYFRKGETIRIEEVIYSYFVPDDAKKTFSSDFYQELGTKKVKKVITNLLQKLYSEKEEDIDINMPFTGVK